MLRIDIVSASAKVSASGKKGFKTVKKAAVSFCKRERSPAGGEQFENFKKAKVHQTNTYYEVEDEVEDAAMNSSDE